MRAMRLLRTVAHLRPGQVAALVSQRMRKGVENPARVLSWNPPGYPGCRWQPAKSFLPPLQTQPAASILAGQLAFLHQTHAVGWPPNWNPPAAPRLWLYNLHYFDWLWSLDGSSARAAVLDWIDRHPPQRGATGWEPYPTSLRLMNWCCFFWQPGQKSLEIDAAACDKVWTSVFRQAEWLGSHIETHLCGNHVLENAAALVVAGSCFDGPEARRWFERGAELLKSQLDEQFLGDGSHYERSPMYHSRAMYVLLMLDHLGDPMISSLVRARLAAGIETLKCMTHPDGQIALLNDSAWNIYNSPADLCNAAGASWPGESGVFSLRDCGYFGARSDDGSYLICDAGSIGPDHQPGHAHGGALSFELSLHGHRVIVDSGVHDYEPGEMRAYCRSTRAHNTVEIDGQDQGEFWSAFRVGRRPRVRVERFAAMEDGFELIAGHDGYRARSGQPAHRREFHWSASGLLEIRDSIRSAAANRIVSRLHLHPRCTIAMQSENTVRVAYPAGSIGIEFGGPGALSVEESWFCPEFGRKVANQALVWSVQNHGLTELACRISPVS